MTILRIGQPPTSTASIRRLVSRVALNGNSGSNKRKFSPKVARHIIRAAAQPGRRRRLQRSQLCQRKHQHRPQHQHQHHHRLKPRRLLRHRAAHPRQLRRPRRPPPLQRPPLLRPLLPPKRCSKQRHSIRRPPQHKRHLRNLRHNPPPQRLQSQRPPQRHLLQRPQRLLRARLNFHNALFRRWRPQRRPLLPQLQPA